MADPSSERSPGMDAAGLAPHQPAQALPVRAEATGLALALLLFALLAALRAWDHPFPFYDDVAYLDLASRIRESGGPLHLLGALFRGEWAEDNRHPLYLALLALVAGRDTGSHLRAQLLGIALGALALLASWWTARKLYGARVALWVLLFLSCSETLIAWSSREACEPLLLFFAALAFLPLLRPRVGPADPGALPIAPGALFLAGLSSGFAWLTKGTGIFIAVCACLALLWESRPHRASKTADAASAASPAPAPPPGRTRVRSAQALLGCACVLAGLVLAALPLLVRNQRRFHSPLHNVNDRFLWIDPLDDFSEVFAPGALERLDRGPLAYLRALTPGKALVRLGRGLGETAVHLGDAMSLVSPRPFGLVHIFWIALGLLAAGVAVRLIWLSKASFARTFLLVHAAFNFAFFVFYNAVSGSSRYLMPLALSLLFPLAAALATSAARANQDAAGSAPARPAPLLPQLSLASLRSSWASRALAACALAVILAVAFDPREHQPPPGYAAAFAAIRARVRPGEAFAVDARSRLQPYWAMDPSARMEILSTSWNGTPLPVDQQLRALRARQVRWILLDGTSRKDDEPRWFFSEQLPLDADGSLPLVPLPVGVHVAWADPDHPRRFALLELEPDRSPP